VSDRGTGGTGTGTGTTTGGGGGSTGGGGLLADNIPTIVSISPSEGPSGGLTMVYVHGHDFAFDGGAMYRA